MIKKNKVRDLVSANCLDFGVVQEDKLVEVFEALVTSLWGNPFCDWSFVMSMVVVEVFFLFGVPLKVDPFFVSRVLVFLVFV